MKTRANKTDACFRTHQQAATRLPLRTESDAWSLPLICSTGWTKFMDLVHPESVCKQSIFTRPRRTSLA